ncbi:hypothetical protein CW304_21810 [Bacillus sp. UFRGS-B20]|nr:hypothetical protein CW304_21810 [Bacillus sp. UFRGS-B20]
MTNEGILFVLLWCSVTSYLDRWVNHILGECVSFHRFVVKDVLQHVTMRRRMGKLFGLEPLSTQSMSFMAQLATLFDIETVCRKLLVTFTQTICRRRFMTYFGVF